MSSMNRRYRNDQERTYQRDRNNQEFRNRNYAQGRDWDTRDQYSNNDRFMNDDSYGRSEYGQYDTDYSTGGRYRNDSMNYPQNNNMNSGDRFRDNGQNQQNRWNQNRFDASYDTEPMSWSYTEVWMIPGPMTGKGPQGYQRSDEDILQEACERLTQHGRVDAEDIRVDCEDGELILEGTVTNRQEKRLAEDAIENISGVHDVQNRLRVEKQHDDTYTSSQNNSPSSMKKNGKSGSNETTSQSRNNKAQATPS